MRSKRNREEVYACGTEVESIVKGIAALITERSLI
jgi:hypothetical protein